jgi:glyoxylase-like metal-dependent hydrolase (beta-lactamase superfamily II)
MAPELDAKEMALTVDKTFKDGELLPGGIWVVQLPHQKSPGESALFLQQGKGVLLVGDGVIGHPAGTLRLLSPEKYSSIAQAREGLRRLLKYAFDSLLVGDGTSILTGAKPVLEQMLAHE